MLRLTVIAWLAATVLAHAQAVLTPPFGLKWGDSPETLVEWAARHTLDVTISAPGKHPELRILRVQPASGVLPGSKARAVEARFLSGRLFEVAIHYGSQGESATVVTTLFNEVRRDLTREHGPLAANQQNRIVEDKFSTRTLSFHREPVKGLFLLLALTEIEDQLRNSAQATFSVIYRNDNFREQLESSVVTSADDH